MGILVVIALETDAATKIVLAMESGVIAVNAIVIEIVMVIELGVIAVVVIEIVIDIEIVIQIQIVIAIGMGILVVIALETNTVTQVVLAMELGIIAINANANTANLGSITTIVLCSVIIIAIIIITIEISLSIETIQMTISCWGCWGIRSAQWQGELDGPDVTGRDVSWCKKGGCVRRWRDEPTRPGFRVLFHMKQRRAAKCS